MYDLIEKSCLFIINILYHQTTYCTILFVLIIGLAYLLKRKSPFWQMGLWLLILFRLILPTDLSFSLSARNLIDEVPLMDKLNVSMEKNSNKLGIIQQLYQNFELNRFGRTGDQRDKKTAFQRNLYNDLNRSISWPTLLVVVWFLGCLISFIFFLNKICSINRVLNHSSLIQDKRITAFKDYWCQAFKIRRSVKIFSSNEFLSPFTVGLFRPKIFIPQSLIKSADNETINSIIAHEMVHIKHFDYLWIRLQSVLQIIYFFHPVVWYANRQISLARERICDYIVLAKRVIPPREYGKGVINVLELNLFGYRPVEPLPCFSNHKKIYEHRIRDILKEDTMKKQKTLFIVLAVCLLGLFLLPLSDSQTGSAQSEKEAANEKIEFIMPMKGWISSEYGYRDSPFTGEKEFHKGIDIAARFGTPINAAASGIVKRLGSSYGYGRTVTLQHGDDYETVYAHCDKILVKEGQAVKSGDIIATNGRSGRTTGPQLHFELKKYGVPVDPLKYIGAVDEEIAIYVMGERHEKIEVLDSVPFLILTSKTSATQSEKVTGNEKIEFIMPMKGWISSEYGYRIHPFTNKREFHEGIDIAARIGTPIYAAASGIVEKVDFSEHRGKIVTLQHNGGFITIYTRCDKILVQEGQHVKSGDVIAKSGNSGTLSTGPHIHFELRKNGKPVDPLRYIKAVD
jgi:murein DD-endopeptidase MepM/ murein hydrolase activator NlpD